MSTQDAINIPSFFITFFMICLWIFWRYFRTLEPTYPAGPLPLPIIGNLHLFFSKDRKEVFNTLRHKYGDVFTVYFGTKPYIIVCGYQYIKDIFKTHGNSFASKPKAIFGREDMKGLVRSSGKTWVEQRQFALRTLKNLGMGNSVLETKILNEMSFLTEYLDKFAKRNEPLDPKDITYSNVANVLFSVLFGKRCNYGNELFRQLLSVREDMFNCSGTMGFVDLKILKRIPGDFFKLKRMTWSLGTFRQIMTKLIEDSLLGNEMERRDFFVGTYVDQIQKMEDEPDTTFHDEQMVQVVSDLYGAGVESTFVNYMWIYLYLVNYPEIQQRLWEEIRDNIGTERKPTMSDKPNLPNLEAFFTEVLRACNFTLLMTPRCATEDVTIGKYVFPAESSVMAYMHSISYDKQLWGDPENFRPSRFLDENGHFQKPEHAVFFSLGKRNCIGESFALMNLFLATTLLVQRYEFFPPEGETVPELKGKRGVFHSPLPYRVQLKMRNV